jgi:predicted NodU family carbamoyl transferase
LHSDSFIRFYLKYIKNKRIFRNLGVDANRIETTVIEHQLAHAATAYRSSPYGYDQEDILILTADGSGDGLSSYIRIGMGKEIGAASLLNHASHGEIKRIDFLSY